MSTWLRRGVLGLVLVLVLVLLTATAAGTWLVLTFDANRYKTVAVDWMKSRYHRTLSINGPMGLALFPRLQVTLADVRLSEAGSAAEFASFEHAEVAVDLLPLLRREVVVGHLSASGVRAAYQRNAAGVRNIDDLLQASASPSTARPTPAAAAEQPFQFDISGIALSDLRLQVADAPGHIDGEVLVQSLRTGRLRDRTDTSVDLVMQLQMKSPAVKGELRGDTGLRFDLVNGALQTRRMHLTYVGDVGAASAITAALQGDVAWDGSNAAFDATSVQLKWAATAAGMRIDRSSLSADRLAYHPAAKTITLAKVKLQLDGTHQQQALSLALDWPELAVAADRIEGSAFSGRLQRSGSTPLDARFTSQPPRGNFDRVNLPGVVATVNSGSAPHQVTGTLKGDLVITPAQGRLPASMALSAVQLQALIDPPNAPANTPPSTAPGNTDTPSGHAGLQPLKLNATGVVTASAQRASWTLAGDINGGAFNTQGQALWGGGVPRLDAAAQFDTLDLNRLLPPAPANHAASGTDKNKDTIAQAAANGTNATNAANAADSAVDLSPLRSVDGQFSLQAAHLVYRQYRIDAARIAATLRGGALRVSALQGQVWGGNVDASARADAASGRIGIKGAASGIDMQRALREVAGRDSITGIGRVTFDIESAGRNLAELKSHTQGVLALQLRDGAIKGINLAQRLRQAKAAINLRQDDMQKASAAEQTDFSELSASFQIADGVAHSSDLDARSPFLRLGGAGDIDIGRGRIDYLARATVSANERGQTEAGHDTAELAALVGLQVPVRLSGPFDAVDWHIQWSSVVKGAVTQRLKNELRDRLEEQLGLRPKPASADAGASAPAAPAKPKDLLKDALRKWLK